MKPLNPIPEEQNTLPPMEDGTDTVLSGEELYETSRRYSLALRGDYQSQEEFAGYLNAGLESTLREQAATQQEGKKLEEYTNLARGLAGLRDKTPQEEQMFQDILKETANLSREDRETILERKFGGALTAYGVSLFGTEETKEELEDPSGAALDKISYLQSHVTLMEGARKLAAEMTAARQDKSYLSTGYETLVNMVPFLETLNLNLASEEDEVSLFTGEAQKEIADMLLWMDDGEAALKKLREIVSNVAGVSEWQAIALAEYVAGGSWSDRVLGNTFTAFDIATAGSGAVATKAAKSVTGLAKATVATAAGKNTSSAKVLANFGKNAEAAKVSSQKIVPIVNNPNNKFDIQFTEGLTENLPMIFRPKGTFFDDYGGDHSSQTAQMVQSAQIQAKQAMTPLFEKVRASRHTAAETDELLKINEALLKREGTATGEQLFGDAYGTPIFQLPQPYAIGARYEPSFKIKEFTKPEETLSDSGYLTVEYASPVTGNGFTSELEAKRWASEIMKFSPADTNIRQVGGSYFVDRVTPFVELSDGSLAASLKDDAMLADSVPSLIISRLLSSDTFLSKHDLGTTKVAMHLPARVKDSLEATIDAIAGARESKKQFEEFAGFLHKQTTTKWIDVDPVTGDTTQVLGKWSEDANKFTADFLDYTAERGARRPPTRKELEAYVAFRQLQDVDWAHRATKLLQQQNAKGIKSIQIDPIMTPSGQARIKPFKGRVVTKLPNATDKEFVVAHVDSGGLKDIYTNVDESGRGAGNYQANLEEIQRLIDQEGYKLVELAQPDNYPLQNFLGQGKQGFSITDERVDYILVKKFGARTLRLNQADTLRKSEGGHHVYDVSEYVGQDQVHQTKTGRTYLKGFKSAFGQKREGTKVTDSVLADMNKIREMVKAGDEEGALAYARQSSIPYDPVQFIRGFNKYIDEDGVEQMPTWDVNIPFRKARHGTVAEAKEIDLVRKAYPNLRAGEDVRNNLWESIDKKFIGSRSTDLLDTIVEKEGRYTTMPAPMRSPIDVINSAAHNMVRSIGFDNVKVSTVNKWIAKYGRYLDADIEDVKNNPVWYFHNGTLRAGDPKVAKMAQIDKKAVENILGTPSETQTTLEVYRSKLSTMVEETFGSDFADSFDNLALMKTRDPFKFARGFAFHSKIGLFNPVQAVLQAQSVAHGMMISGLEKKDTWAALAGTVGSRMLMKNGKQGKFVQSVMRKMGYDPDEFKEAHEWMVKYGINRIEGEHALLDDLLETNMFQGKTGRFIDKGAFFFREGELIPRMTSWHIAFKEWRKANPNKKPTRLDLEGIAARQDVLSNNMTRKSSSDIQHGWTSTATQFWGWQMRLMEAMLGKKITRKEQARLITGYAAMYGIPGATAGALGLPTAVVGAVTGQLGIDAGALGSTDHYADIKKYALENGIDLDNGFLEVLSDGLISKGIEGLTGQDTNWAQRMGPGGLFLWEDLSNNEAGIMDLLGGASLGIGKDAYNSMAPITNSLIRMAGLDQEFNATRTIEEGIQALSVVSSVNNVRLGWDILRYQEYRFKNGTLAADNLDVADAALAALVGLSPQEIPDAFLKQEAMSEGKGSRNKTEGAVADYLKEHRRMAAQAVKHYARGNEEAARNYENSATMLAELISVNYPSHAWKIGRAFTRDSMVEQIGRRFESYIVNEKAKKEISEDG